MEYQQNFSGKSIYIFETWIIPNCARLNLKKKKLKETYYTFCKQLHLEDKSNYSDTEIWNSFLNPVHVSSNDKQALTEAPF